MVLPLQSLSHPSPSPSPFPRNRPSLHLLQPFYDRKKTKQEQTIPGMAAKERRLVAKVEAATIPRPACPATLSSTVSTTSPSTGSPNTSGSGSSRASSPKLCSFPKATRGVVYFARVARISPGAAFVSAARPTVRADPRGSHLSGSGAIGR